MRISSGLARACTVEWLVLAPSSAPVRSVRRGAMCSVTSRAGQCGDAARAGTVVCVCVRLRDTLDRLHVCVHLRHMMASNESMMLCCLFESRT